MPIPQDSSPPVLARFELLFGAKSSRDETPRDVNDAVPQHMLGGAA